MTTGEASEQGLRPDAPARPARGWPVLRNTLTLLAGPQGFTLSIAGTLAATIGQRGVGGLLDIWVFVLGGSAGFCLLVLLAGAVRRPADGPGVPRLAGTALLNATPLAVVPVAVLASMWIPSHAVGYLVAGALGTAGYVLLLALLVRFAGARV